MNLYGGRQAEKRSLSPRVEIFEINSQGIVGLTPFDTVMDTAVALSFAVRITFAVIMLVVFVRVTSLVLIQQIAMEDSRRRHLLTKLGVKLTQQEDDIRPEDMKVNPFVMPLILIDVILVFPIRKRFANSLRRFTQEWVEFNIPGKGKRSR